MVSVNSAAWQPAQTFGLNRAKLPVHDEALREERIGSLLSGATREKFLTQLEGLPNPELRQIAPRLRKEESVALTPEAVVRVALMEVHNNLIRRGFETSANGHPTGDVLRMIGGLLYNGFPELRFQRFIEDCSDLLERIRCDHLEWPPERVDHELINRFEGARNVLLGQVLRLSRAVEGLSDGKLRRATHNLSALFEALSHDDEPPRAGQSCAPVFAKCAALSRWARHTEWGLAKAPKQLLQDATDLKVDINHLARELLELKLINLRAEIEFDLPNNGIFCSKDFRSKMDQVIRTLHSGQDGTYSFEPLAYWVSHAHSYACTHKLRYLSERLQDLKLVLGYAEPYVGTKQLKKDCF